MDSKVLTGIAVVAGGTAVMAVTLYLMAFGVSTDHFGMADHDPLDSYGSLYVLGPDGALSETVAEREVSTTDIVVVGREWAENNREVLDSRIGGWVSSGAVVAALDSNAGIFDVLKGDMPLAFDPDAQVNAVCKRSVTFCLSLSCSGGSDWKAYLSDGSWVSAEKADGIKSGGVLTCASTSVYDDGIRPVTRFTDMAYWLRSSSGTPYMTFIDDNVFIVNVNTFFYHVLFADLEPGRASMKKILISSEIQPEMTEVDGARVRDSQGGYSFSIHVTKGGNVATWEADKGNVTGYSGSSSKDGGKTHTEVQCSCSKKTDQAHASYGWSFARTKGTSTIEWTSSISAETVDGMRHSVTHASLRSSMPIPSSS